MIFAFCVAPLDCWNKMRFSMVSADEGLSAFCSFFYVLQMYMYLLD